MTFDLKKYRKLDAGIILVLVTALVFHVLSYFYVKAFYEQNLPHYDSVGSYTLMFEIMNTYHRDGFMAALGDPSNYFLSWLQWLFAVLGAPLLSATPESLQILNSLALLIFMLSIYFAAKAYGAGTLKAYMIALIVFIPDVFYDWWGGMMDLRRDFAFFSLLGATFFTFFNYVWLPTKIKAIFLGLLIGLTVFSRDNAIFFVVFIILPMAICWFISKVYSKNGNPFKEILSVFLTSMAFILPWIYFSFNKSMARRLDPFTAYGGGADRWDSFMAHWEKPFQLMFGRVGDSPREFEFWTPLTPLGNYLGGKDLLSYMGHMAGGVKATLPITGGWLVSVGLIILIFNRVGWVNLKMPKWSKWLWLLAAGIWALLVTYFMICYVVALKPLDFSSAQIPFFPSLLLFFSFLFIVGISIHSSDRLSKAALNVIATMFVASLFVVVVLRLEAKAPEPTKKYVAIAKQLTTIFSEGNRGPSIAFIWHDTISYDTLAFYNAQLDKPNKLEKFRYYFEGNSLDFAVSKPSSVNQVKMLLAMKQQIDANADYVVVSPKPGVYNNYSHHFFVFQYGQDLVDTLLNDDRFHQVISYELWGTPFVVLKRKQ